MKKESVMLVKINNQCLWVKQNSYITILSIIIVFVGIMSGAVLALLKSKTNGAQEAQRYKITAPREESKQGQQEQSIQVELAVMAHSQEPQQEISGAQILVQQLQKAKPQTEKLELAVVKKGEGIEHSLIRQLIANPDVVGNSKYVFKGDITNKETLKKWARTTAHNIAVDGGYVAQGKEIRVKSPNTVSFLLENGETGLSIREHTKDVSGSFNLQRTLSVPNPQFQENQAKNIPPYEYLAVC